MGFLLTAIGTLRLARAVRCRWRPVLAGAVLIVAGVILRDSVVGVLLVPGLLFFYAALLMEARPGPERERLLALRRELAGYSTPAQRSDLEATLDRYPDAVTSELRDILAGQAMVTRTNGIPGAWRH